MRVLIFVFLSSPTKQRFLYCLSLLEDGNRLNNEKNVRGKHLEKCELSPLNLMRIGPCIILIFE